MASAPTPGVEMKAVQDDNLDALVLELTCPICLHLFSEPASLPCGHMYCLACLHTMGEGLDQHRCPECQAEFRGADDLVKNVKMCSVVETYRAAAAAEKARAAAGDSPSSDASGGEEPKAGGHQDVTQDPGCEAKDGFRSGPGSSEQTVEAKMEMDESKVELASRVAELRRKLEGAEGALSEARRQEAEEAAANDRLREKTSGLLGRMEDLLRGYRAEVTRLLAEQLEVGEAGLRGRVRAASEAAEQLRRAALRAESLLTQEDARGFQEELRALRPQIAELLEKPVGEEEDGPDPGFRPARGCPDLEKMSSELRDRVGEIQRSLRNVFNPSEVTFDPETAHPNLVLSGDLKTATFSAAKQPYPPSPLRFTSFFQVLSAQTFSEGDHRWEVELEGSPWIVGVCHGGQLERSGLASALESGRGSWCLMWFNNLLTAFEQSRGLPLKRTTASRRLEVRLSFKTQRLSFHDISPVSGNTHVHTFKLPNLTEPVHLAYRMMAGHPKARVTIYS